MKQIAALTLGVGLTAALSLSALAAGTSGPLIAPAPGAQPEAVEVPATGEWSSGLLVLNGTALDPSGLPAAPAYDMLPLRLLAEADHGGAYWDEETNSGSFYLEQYVVNVDFATGAITVDDQAVEGKAQVVQGVTFVPASVLDGLEGYAVNLNPEMDVDRIDVTTPNSDPMIQLLYQLADAAGVGYGMKTTAAELEETKILSEGVFTKGVGLLPMMTNPDTVILGKVAEGKLEQAKADLEAYRKSQEDTFSWYLAQHLPKVQEAQVAVSGDWVLFVIGENAGAAVELFQTSAAGLE